MIAKGLGMRVVFIDGMVENRDQALDQGQLFLGDPQAASGFAQGLFLLGVGNRIAALLRDFPFVQIGPRLHHVFLALLDLRLPVTKLVALEPIAHPAQLHVDSAERVSRVLGERDHRQLEILERLNG